MFRVERLELEPLWQQSGNACDRSRESGREEARGSQIGQVVGSWFRIAPINIDGVGERLERVKRKSEGKYPGPGFGRRRGEMSIGLEQEGHVLHRCNETDV